VELKSGLSTSFQITDMIKPGACATNMGNTSEIEFLNLRSQDAIILNAGANDVYKNNKGTALTQITNFIQCNYGTNVIILDLPHRYDLS
jgi:hypothetical protein